MNALKNRPIPDVVHKFQGMDRRGYVPLPMTKEALNKKF